MNEPTYGEDVLSAYLDGECTDAERAWVEDQLATSPATRAALEDVRVARDAVRALPMVDPDPAFWSAMLGDDVDVDADADADEDGVDGAHVVGVAHGVGVAAATIGAPVDLDARRRARRPRRWLVAAGGGAAAAVIAAIVLVPQPKPVTPPVASFADAHAVRSSLQNDAVSSLAPLGVQAPFHQ